MEGHISMESLHSNTRKHRLIQELLFNNMDPKVNSSGNIELTLPGMNCLMRFEEGSYLCLINSALAFEKKDAPSVKTVIRYIKDYIRRYNLEMTREVINLPSKVLIQGGKV